MRDFEQRKRDAETVEVIDVDGSTPIRTESESVRRLRILSHILYGLYALSWFTGGLSGLVGLIIDYVKRSEVRGTMYASHATWRIRTFWGALICSAFASLFLLIHIGFFFLFLIWIWTLYRLVRGWVSLFDRKPMYRAALLQR